MVKAWCRLWPCQRPGISAYVRGNRPALLGARAVGLVRPGPRALLFTGRRSQNAQKENLVRLVHKLDERGKEEIEEIDLALDKMNSGSYGICELCDRSIPFKRLKALPATRLCRNYAQKYEEAQKLRKHHRDEIIGDELLDEYRSLNDESEINSFKGSSLKGGSNV